MAVEKLIVDHIDTWTTALQTRSTAGRGSSGKIELYGIKKLRELILELAVRGKLVPQDPNDEPASELLKHIAAEKAELVKQGKIKKPKPLPEISEEEKPFELPEGWEWVRFGSIYEMEYGNNLPQEKRSNSGEYNVYGSNGIVGTHNEACIKSPCIVIGRKGSAGALNLSDQAACWVTDVAYSTIPPSAMNLEFVFVQFHTLGLDTLGKGIKPGLNRNDAYNLTIAIPPQSEQKAIVSKVNELMSLCDQLEQHSLTSLDAHQQLVETLLTTLTDSQNADELAENWARISEHFDTLFTTETSIDALKQTILQLAVMGKLVPQDPNDEPASELLKRIAQEKAQLVKDGKMKKQKQLPPISDGEKPFELPDGWEWVKLGNILHDIKYGTSQKCDYNISGYPVLRIPNIVKGIIDLADIKYGALTDSELKDLTLNKNDLLFIRSNGSTNIVGQSTLVQHDLKDHAYAGYIIRVRLHNEYINARYINMVMKSNLIREQIEGPIRTTTGVKNINSNELMGLLVPLPPKNEQGIIIKKINEIDTTLSNLKVSIQSAQQTQVHLADALTDAAIN
ncbi:restriction endonuclease subunit S [Salmonella enterica]|uniref:restriction endonuclease subunit S n=2 Tax=Salmonella enterica TaxID=28901 RepID=UPI0009AF96F0|nr:restriction endonuclease subunit S [Salmonella enterica]EBS2228741.1 restriction endonuclease subunit S [Salmonella enterica subsp. enterica serovar Middlesbrough]EAA9674969.1 restriction endonuclease subunit S [Salmonella enterica]EDK2431899.1 restriction endonuclease subunit S [Salmonella enterica subsp. enterica serovar Derby]EEB6656533.1 restriction endonuclease subunit S [Salmonella enterica subsp. enterica serovar Derby]EEE9270534.1 restriction endonuclease subunit S [Salmonella enter